MLKQFLSMVPVLALLSSPALAVKLEAAKWTEVRTKNFVVRSAMSKRKAVKLARSLEYFRAAAALVTNVSSTESYIPTNVYLLRNKRDLALFDVDATTAGYILPTLRNYNIVVRDTTGMSETGIILHEYVHYLIRNHGGLQYPMWFDEGFAEYLGGSELRGKFFKIGLPQQGRLYDLATGRMLPMDELLSADQSYDDWPDAKQRMLYAQSWLLLHYLSAYRSSDINIAASMADYLQRVEEGADVSAAFTAAFGIDVTTVNKELKKYAKENRYTYLNLPADLLLEEFDYTTRRLSPEEVALALAELARAHDNPELAAPWFATASGDPSLEGPALLGLAWAALHRDEMPVAIELASRGINKCPEDPYCQLDAGLLALSQRDSANEYAVNAELLAQAREFFAAAWRLDKTIPEVYLHYGESLIVDRSDVEKGIEMIEEAQYLVRSNLRIRFVLGLAYADAGRHADARNMLRSVLAWSHADSAMAEATRFALQTLDNQASLPEPQSAPATEPQEAGYLR